MNTKYLTFSTLGKTLKYAFYFAFVSFVLNACEGVLQEDPVSLAVADSHYTTKVGINDGLNAAYKSSRSFYGRESAFFMTIMGTDEFTNGFGGVANYPYYNNYDINMKGTLPFFSELWNNFYVGINQCNTIVARTPSVKDMNETEKGVAIGEARFLRALYYFHLVQQFGAVHFSLDETIGVETEANRTPVNTIYDQGIIPDLKYAVEKLPNAAKNYGRATKPAAEALLARVMLTLGNWSEAEKLANNVINNYNFALVKPYSNLWKVTNDANEEIVWSVQYTSDPLTNGEGNSAHLYFIWDYTQNPTMVRDIENGRPFQRCMPTNYFLNLWDLDSDLRFEHSFKTVWYSNKGGTINGKTVKLGDTSIYIVLRPVDDNIQKTAPYWYIDYNKMDVTKQTDALQVGGRSRRLWPNLWKFYDNLRIDVNATDGRRDFPVIRLAEMYLVSAEAAHKLNNNTAAANMINKLRERATKPGREAQMKVNPGDITLDFILDERMRELGGEMHRWYDLKRTGLLIDRVKKHNPDAAPNIKEMHLVRPIPQTQIDRVSNPDVFSQNPGY